MIAQSKIAKTTLLTRNASSILARLLFFAPHFLLGTFLISIQPQRDRLRNAILTYRDAIDGVRTFNRCAVMRDDDELRLFTQPFQRVAESSDVCLVEHRVDFVHYAEWRG